MWQDPYDRMAKMAPVGGDGYGLYGDDEGLYLGPGIALVKRQVDADGVAHFAVRPQEELDVLLHAAYGMEVDLSRRMSILAAVANALQKGEWSRAMISAAHLQLPPLPDDAAVTRLRGVDQLLKYNFNPDEPRDWHGRWTYVGGGASSRQGPEKDRGVQIATSDPVLADQITAQVAMAEQHSKARRIFPKDRDPSIAVRAKSLDNISTAKQRGDDINRVMGHEGGYSNNKNDHGGETYYGITAAGLKDYNSTPAKSRASPFSLDDLDTNKVRHHLLSTNPGLSVRKATQMAEEETKR